MIEVLIVALGGPKGRSFDCGTVGVPQSKLLPIGPPSATIKTSTLRPTQCHNQNFYP
jgi:hypothetical protein